MKLKPEVKEIFLEALRSNDYKQGRGSLRIVEDGQCSFCCLGVLTDLYLKENDISWYKSGFRSNLYLPEVVSLWALEGGLIVSDFTVSDLEHKRLSGLNDKTINHGIDFGKKHANDFSVIANIIEEQL